MVALNSPPLDCENGTTDYIRIPTNERIAHDITSSLILAGTLANSGLEAKVVRFSTASVNGLVACAQLARFSSEKFPSNACKKITSGNTYYKIT